MNVIEINHLRFGYAGRDRGQKRMVLDGITLRACKGESVGIIGANGVGKSTLLKLLIGLLTDYEGEVLIDGLPAEKKNMTEIRRKVGYVFQDSDSQLFLNTVREDVAFGPRNYGLDETQTEELVNRALKQAHIEDLADRHIYRLSGGQKKLAAIATVLAMGTDIMLLDEPSEALDPRNRDNLIAVLNELEATKLIASHDLDFIYDTCDRVVILKDGRVAAHGDSKELLRDKKVLEENGLCLPLSFRFIKDR